MLSEILFKRSAFACWLRTAIAVYSYLRENDFAEKNSPDLVPEKIDDNTCIKHLRC